MVTDVLSAEQLRSFARDGYVVLPGVVDAGLCERANARIDELIASRPPAEGHTGHHFYFESPDDEPVLMRTLAPAWPHAEALVAPLELDRPAHVQVALTFPPYRHRPGGGHIDGISGREPDGRPGTFTMLAGVALSDQTRDNMGNLFVWPGSHRQLGQYLREHGPDALLTSDGVPPLDFFDPVQVHAAPGDLLLAHYLLSHNIGGNTSSIIRRTLYFRLKVAGHNERWREVVTDPLLEFSAVRAAG